MDRLVPGLPYGNEENLRILCSRCNTAKSDLTAAELRQLADWVDREMREMSNPAT